MIPQKAILTKNDLDLFHEHQTFLNLLQFIDKLNTSCRNLKLKDDIESSPIINELCQVLITLQSYIHLFPPVTNEKSRFGNPAFREWFDHVQLQLKDLLHFIPLPVVEEVSTYLLHSFGDRQRIDYGTGHELSFVIFLFCMDQLNLFYNDYSALVLRVFWQYILLMRALQKSYWLEPAGSHGVWGLDDYHFLPFLFGSSQLYDHKYLRPKSIHDKEIIQEFSKDYMYLACIEFINQVKTESLAWHSPMLNDISGVKKWQKVNQGLVKMYQQEVLYKLPIMQHVRFGTLFPFQSSSEFPDETKHFDGHEHVYAFGQEFPTCCGMRIPSAFAAAAEKEKKTRLFPVD